MNFSYFLDNKSKALWLDEKQLGGSKQQTYSFAKIQKPGTLKLQTFKRKLQFSDSHAKPDAKGL